ncbi:potassium/proton antiporter [Paenibacillus chitinolyticus]|uniref:potassium/proton antiporter n=1 Tax=Paenibacillus chitinolyticus TaxID=79263 RepID=UPI002DB90417|nr:potassium/proton antiporter [Paenibacillus chitinolyticus]MEC0249266.1 potassium/proton antiporter [Paenibacillus chitinolyticus]
MTEKYIFLIAVLLFAGVLMSKFSSRFGLPALVFFMLVGMGLNRFIYFDNAQLTQWFGLMALIVILFDGGMHTKWTHVKEVIRPSLMLATAGVLLTTAIVGLSAYWILQVTLKEGLLLGAIVGSTDAAAVFAVLGNQNVKRRLTSTLEAESGTNDPMAVFLTVSLIELIQMPDTSILLLIGSFLWEMGFGLVLGLVIGRLAVWSLNKIDLDSSGLYPVLALAFAIFTYGSTALLHGSGLLAVYVMALRLGNADFAYRFSITRFHEGFAWMMQILMFMLLGLLAFPDDLISIAWQGVALALILMFVARPVGVFGSMLGTGFQYREKLLISWAGLRGAVPIVLATYPLLAGLEHGRMFFNIVFFIVLLSTLVQGSTISVLSKKLGLTEGSAKNDAHTLELLALGKANAEIIEIKVTENGPVNNRLISDLELPEEVLITAIVRKGKIITPHGNTELIEGDLLYTLVSKPMREKVKKIFYEESPAIKPVDLKPENGL